MMLKPTKSVKYLKHQNIECGDIFSILCWNTAKLNLTSSYKELLSSILDNENIDILLLQEVKKSIANKLDVSDYSYVLSPNIETREHLFGVLSAFKISCRDDLSLLTKKRELSYTTHKVSLITIHKISNNKELMIVNLHAINFVSTSDFYHELNTLKFAIKSHHDPMIVAGDFNTWNRQRVKILNEFARELSLKEVAFSDRSNIKTVFSNSLDYIFYRDLELHSSKVLDTKKISDHNPIMATFKLL